MGGGGDFQRLRHTAEAGFAALGHLAAVGADDVHAIGCEHREIALGRLGGPHARVHGGRHQDRPVGRQQYGAGEIVGVAARHFRHQIGGRRRNDDEIGIACETDMPHIELGPRIKQIRKGGLAAQRAGGERRHEVLRGAGENAAHLSTAVLQAADEIERFVGGDAAADDEKDALAHRRGCGRPEANGPAAAGRLGLRQNLPARVLGGLPQNDAHLVFHGPAMPRGAEPEQRLELLIQLPDGEAGHQIVLIGQDYSAPMIALQSSQSMAENEPG